MLQLRLCHTSVASAAVQTAQQASRQRKWIWTGVVAASLGLGVIAASQPDVNQILGDGPEAAGQQLQKTFKEQLSDTAASLWPASLFRRIKGKSTAKEQEPSFASSVASQVRATSARWLAQWAEDAEAREALLAFGSDYLLDFLVATATEDPSLEQAHAEQALVNFLGGHHTCSRLLARPGAVPKLLQHIASGKASDELQQQLQSVLASRSVDMSHSLHLEDGRKLIMMLEGRHGQQVQSLALQFITTWARCGQEQRSKLSALGLAPALARLAMEAVGRGEEGRQLQADVCR
eukprot:gene3428-3700_t